MTQNKTILVTGGAGFIGSHTVVALAEAGFRPIIIDDFSNSEQRVLAGLHQILGYEVPCYPKNCNDAATLRTIFKKKTYRVSFTSLHSKPSAKA